VFENKQRIYEHVRDACFFTSERLESLAEFNKLDKNFKDFLVYQILEIDTFEDQINKSIDLLQYTKRQLKSKKCQNALKKIKEEYKLE